MVRFDDHADGSDGERLYENRTVLVVHTRWGRIVDHEDFYVDTSRFAAFDRRLLRARGRADPEDRVLAAPMAGARPGDLGSRDAPARRT